MLCYFIEEKRKILLKKLKHQSAPEYTTKYKKNRNVTAAAVAVITTVLDKKARHIRNATRTSTQHTYTNKTFTANFPSSSTNDGEQHLSGQEINT